MVVEEAHRAVEAIKTGEVETALASLVEAMGKVQMVEAGSGLMEVEALNLEVEE